MKDGPGRRSVKRIALVLFDLRLGFHRAYARRAGDIRYELGGACARSGQCCEAPAIQVGKLTWHVPLFRRLFLWWHERVNGFLLEGLDRASRAFVFRCTHYERDSRRCDSYDSRPGMCRDYPLVLLEQANPLPFERCGFKVLALNREKLLRALEKQSLEPHQMEKLRKGLNLE